MADKKTDNKKTLSSKEPVFIIKPAFKNFGLDYLHITLIALVVVLIVLAFALSTFKQGVIITNCSNGASANATCNSTVHNSTQALSAAQRYLASYTYFNTSLSLVPYYSLINQSKVDYLASQKQWFVVIPYIDPLASNTRYNVSMTLYDSNLSIASTYVEAVKPTISTNNSVVGLGTIQLYGRAICTTSKPIPVYVVTDPYAPGALNALSSGVNASKKYGGEVNVSYFFVFSGYSQQFYTGYGQEYTQQMGKYMYCASRQPASFSNFLSNLSMPYEGKPLTNGTLYDVALGSKLNITQFNSCIANSTAALDYQNQFANLYHIISTPTVIVNCQYGTLPQTMDYAVNYSLSHLNG